MDLAAQVSSAVAAAAAATGALFVTVTLERKTGQDGYGKPTYADPVEYQAFVWRESASSQLKLTRLMGGETVEGAKVLFLENVVISVQDQITLNDGAVAPVASVDSVSDPAGGVYYAQANCGRPERGTLQS